MMENLKPRHLRGFKSVELWNGEGAACMHMNTRYMEMSTHGLMQWKLYNDQYG